MKTTASTITKKTTKETKMIKLIKCPIKECPCEFATEADKNNHIYTENNNIIHNVNKHTKLHIIKKHYTRKKIENEVIEFITNKINELPISQKAKKWKLKKRLKPPPRLLYEKRRKYDKITTEQETTAITNKLYYQYFKIIQKNYKLNNKI